MNNNLETKARQGDIGAQLSLGNSYYEGKGVERDHDQAIYWYTKAANQGNSDAMYMLGKIYLTKDASQAIFWLQAASEAGGIGSVDANYELGKCYYDGKGVSYDYNKAVEYFKSAAESGQVDAMIMLGECYYNGKGVECDYKEALRWYLEAENAGSDSCLAQFRLGLIYSEGKDVEVDKSEAVYWFKKSAKQDCGEALYELGRNCINKDKKQAVEYYHKAVDAANWCLGHYDRWNGWNERYVSAIFMLGMCYQIGDGVNQDYSQAFEWYKKGAEECDDRASKSCLATCYFHGYGVHRSFMTGLKWLIKSRR